MDRFYFFIQVTRRFLSVYPHFKGFAVGSVCSGCGISRHSSGIVDESVSCVSNFWGNGVQKSNQTEACRFGEEVRRLFPDTEIGKNFSKEVVGGELSGDFIQAVLCPTQVFRE